MKLPNAENAYVEERKITAYLLDPSHPVGSSKARFFLAFGFSVSEWRVFESALIEHAQTHEVVEVEHTSYGVKYVIIGAIETPDGRNPKRVRVVWQIDHGGSRPRLVAALPF